MRGGEEEPCVSRAHILKIQESDPEAYCPRVDLMDGSEAAAELALFAARVGADNLVWAKLFDLHVAGLDAEDAMSLYRQALNALGDELISAKIKASRERERKS